jgi:hypothetical protein
MARDGTMTKAEADQIRAEGKAQGLEVCICAEIVDPDPGLVDSFMAWLFPSLHPEAEAEAEA